MLSGWGTKIPVMLQCAGLMHYRGYFDGRCLMEDVGCLMLINDNEWSAECVLQLIESPSGEKSDKNIKDRTDVIEMEQFILYELPY